MTRIAKRAAAVVAAMVLAAGAAAHAQSDAPNAGQRPGVTIKIDPAALPKPNATPSANNSSMNITRLANATPQVPPGFSINLFATDLPNARNLMIASNGDVLLTESALGKIVVLRNAGNAGKAESVETFAQGFHLPYGLAIHGGALYVGDTEGVWRIPYTPGDTKAQAQQTRITPPGALGNGQGHFTRNVLVSGDGKTLYVADGSSCNICEDAVPRATVQVFDLNADGTQATNEHTYASGTRNPVGIAFYPGTSDLYAVVNERDGLGDELPPDYFTKVVDGGFYGWPYSYIGHNPQPGFAEKRPDLVAKAIVPDVLFRSHSAPLGLAFYTGNQFPADYRGGAFVSLHGSWNAAKPRGYMVVYVPFSGGKPAGDYVVFASGFWSQGTGTAEVFGRPVGLAVAKDGSLLIADDVASVIWRVSYGAK